LITNKYSIIDKSLIFFFLVYCASIFIWWSDFGKNSTHIDACPP